MAHSPASDSTVKSRLAHELKSYALVSAYLFVCFSVILFYDAGMSSARPSSAVGIGLGAAVIKALIIGKFILIGEIMQPGSRVNAPTLLHRVAWRSLGLLLVLIVLKLVEELIVALIHGGDMRQAIDELSGQSWQRLLAPTLMMLLILIPLMIAIELDRTLGKGSLRDLFLRRRADE